MPVIYGPQPLKDLNTETRHGFEEQYSSEQYLESLENDFIFYFDDKRHKTNGNPTPEEVKEKDEDHYYQPIYDWKIMKERQKTVSAALLLCLNLGVDPPDVVKTHPCARLESWVDPLSFQDSKKAIEQIGKNLQAHYETLSLRTRYKQSLDPCVEDVKRFCNFLRRASKDERILFHYNGHGVPQPTTSGEMWVFNRGYTQYIPVSLYDLQTWLGAPCIYVYDCNSAGNIVSNFQKFVQKRIKDDQEGNHDIAAPSPTQAYVDCIQLASCAANELLPMNPELPADLFTCCLTCPIEISVEIFLMQSPLRETKYAVLFQEQDQRKQDDSDKVSSRMPNITIPGKLSDRRTPLGELNWIFTAITDTIAWTSLPRPLFKKLFRHDLMVAALFRNFLLAKRIMPWYNCHPVSDPPLPDSIADHAMWKSWDLAIDEVLSKLVKDLKNSPIIPGDLEAQMILQEQQSHIKENNSDEALRSKAPAGTLSTMSLANQQMASTTQFSQQQLAQQQQLQQQQLQLQQQQQQQQFTGFFEQNLTAFELWLKYGSNTRHPPEQLPIVLQVLLSQVHRVRALVLLSRFLDLGPWAVYLSLSIGIFPYVLKLLQSPAQELRPILVFIWARIMSIDYRNTQTELIKEKGYLYFVKMLVPEWGMAASPQIQRTSSIGGGLTMNVNASLGTQRYQLYQALQPTGNTNANALVNNTTDEQKAMAMFVLSSFVRDFPLGQRCCFSIDLVNKLCFYIESSEIPLLRQWCIILMGQLYVRNPLNKYICMTSGYLDKVFTSLRDPVPEVRCAALLAIKMFVSDVDEPELAMTLQQDLQQQIQQLQEQMQSVQSSGQVQRQQVQMEQQLQQYQMSLNQLRNMDSRQLKREEIKITICALGLVNDGSPMVRKELVIFLSHIVSRYINFFIVIAFNELCDEIVQLEASNTESGNLDTKQSVAHGSIFNTVWKALLILAEDPYTENKSLAQQVVESILIKLSEHEQLNEVVLAMEQYLIKHTATSSTSPSSTFASAATLPTPKRPLSLSTSGKIDGSTTRSEEITRNAKRTISLTGLLKKLGFENSSEDTTEKPSTARGYKAQNMSLLSVPHGVAPTAVTPRFKMHEGPIELPLQSTFLDYSREYFQEPQMKRQEADEPGSLEYTARVWRRNRNEAIIQKTQAEKKLALYGDWSNNTATLDNKTQPKILRFSQFENYVVSSDERDNITVFDWSDNSKLSVFSNANPFGTKITDMKFLNEDDTPLLLAGSSDGIVKIYRDFHDVENFELVSSWRGLTDLLLTPRSTGLLTEWQQSRGSLLVTGDVKIIRVWDALTESIEVDIPAKSSSLITSMTSDQLSGNIFVAGFSDGTMRVYDRRVDPRDSMVRLWRTAGGRQNTWITNVHLQRGGYRELISGTGNGVVELWDIRCQDPILAFQDEGDQNSGPKRLTTMTSLQAHEHAPIIATGTKQIKIWTTSGDLLAGFRNTVHAHTGGVAGTLATGIGASRVSSSFVSSMAFHPHKMVLAATNSHSSQINIYECHDNKTDYLYY